MPIMEQDSVRASKQEREFLCLRVLTRNLPIKPLRFWALAWNSYALLTLIFVLQTKLTGKYLPYLTGLHCKCTYLPLCWIISLSDLQGMDQWFPVECKVTASC